MNYEYDHKKLYFKFLALIFVSRWCSLLTRVHEFHIVCVHNECHFFITLVLVLTCVIAVTKVKTKSNNSYCCKIYLMKFIFKEIFKIVLREYLIYNKFLNGQMRKFVRNVCCTTIKFLSACLKKYSFSESVIKPIKNSSAWWGSAQYL